MSYIIAEIGTSHQGSLGLLDELIHAAKESGADCAKFQWVIADEIVHPLTGFVPLPTGNIAIYDRFKELELPFDFYKKAHELCAHYKIDFLCTPFGPDSAKMLFELGVDAFKIASPELNYLPLLEQVDAYGKPIFISSGVSTLSDIDESLGILSTLENKVLLHCITSYPAPAKDFNIFLIRTLREIFGVKTGLSDHSLHAFQVPAMAQALGAVAIEKHFTLSNETLGLDDPIALNPKNFLNMVQVLRKLEKSNTQKNIDKTCDRNEIIVNIMDFFKEIDFKTSYEEVDEILGTGVKKLADSEAKNYGRTNRSIHALRELKAGDKIKDSDFALLRTEKILRPGLHPRHQIEIIGKTLAQDVPNGEGIRWEDFLS